MNNSPHVSEQQLIRAFDGELTVDERAAVDLHVASCETCLEAYEHIAELSAEISHAFEVAHLNFPEQAREQLRVQLAASEPAPMLSRRRSYLRSYLRSYWIGAAAAAACVALLLLIKGTSPQPPVPPPASLSALPPVASNRNVAPAPTSPQARLPVKASAVRAIAKRQPRAMSPNPVDRQSFMPLPYSNPALAPQAAEILRVQMRLSTLANAGLINAMPEPADSWVQADVLLGMDGQPYGIRLVSTH